MRFAVKRECIKLCEALQALHQFYGEIMSNLLINEPPLQVLPTLATYIGLNEAIFLQQVHYWLQIKKVGQVAADDGRKYVRNSMSDWAKQFPFWSENAIRRIISNLEADRLLLKRTDLNQHTYDKTAWYTIDYGRLEQVEAAAQPVAREATKRGKRAAAVATRYENQEPETAVPGLIEAETAASTPLQNVTPLQNGRGLQNVSTPPTKCNPPRPLEGGLQNVGDDTRDIRKTLTETHARAGEAISEPCGGDETADRDNALWATAVDLVDRWRAKVGIFSVLNPARDSAKAGYYAPALRLVSEFNGNLPAAWAAVEAEYDRMVRDGLTNVRRLEPVISGVLGAMHQQKIGRSPAGVGGADDGPDPYRIALDHASRGDANFPDDRLKTAVRLFGWTRLQQMQQGKENFYRGEFMRIYNEQLQAA